VISWLFPRLKKKHKNENSPNRAESEEVSQLFKDLGIMSMETLKKELMEANENRDAALMEVAEMKSSLGELRQKLEYLETYCEELKRALRQAMPAKDSQIPEKLGTFLREGNPLMEMEKI
jgi:chromosome segregation ATPase